MTSRFVTRSIALALLGLSAGAVAFACSSSDDTAAPITPTPEASVATDTSVAETGAAPVPITGFDDPSKWVLIGGADPTLYEAAADTDVLYNGQPTGRLRGHLPEAGADAAEDAGDDAGDAGTDEGTGFGALIARKGWAVTPYVGKRVRMTGYIKTEGVTKETSGATLWLRFDSSQAVLRLANGFDPTDRSLNGSVDFTKFENVIDVPATAQGTAIFGAILAGEGTLWVGGVTFEEVDPSTPTTPFIDAQ